MNSKLVNAVAYFDKQAATGVEFALADLVANPVLGAGIGGVIGGLSGARSGGSEGAADRTLYGAGNGARTGAYTGAGLSLGNVVGYGLRNSMQHSPNQLVKLLATLGVLGTSLGGAYGGYQMAQRGKQPQKPAAK